MSLIHKFVVFLVICGVVAFGQGESNNLHRNSTLIERILTSLASLRVNKEVYKVYTDLHSTTLHDLWEIRNTKFTWENVTSDIMRAGGHRWCFLQRDNWSCTGEKYIKYLSDIPPFNASLYHPNLLRRGTKIFFEGNSYLAQIMFSLICETNPTAVYRLDRNTNDIIAYYSESDVLILGIDNDKELQTHPSEVTTLLKSVGFYPVYLIVGPSNFDRTASNSNQTMTYKDRLMMFYSAWPESVLVPLQYYHAQTDCAADFLQCHAFPPFHHHHQCFPGSMIPIAQRIMDHLQNEDKFVHLDPQSAPKYYCHSNESQLLANQQPAVSSAAGGAL